MVLKVHPLAPFRGRDDDFRREIIVSELQGKRQEALRQPHLFAQARRWMNHDPFRVNPMPQMSGRNQPIVRHDIG